MTWVKPLHLWVLQPFCEFLLNMAVTALDKAKAEKNLERKLSCLRRVELYSSLVIALLPRKPKSKQAKALEK